MTMSCIWVVFEKQMVLRAKRFMRVRKVRCLRSIFCVLRLPGQCCGSRIPVVVEKIGFRRGDFTPLFVRSDGVNYRLPAAWTEKPIFEQRLICAHDRQIDVMQTAFARSGTLISLRLAPKGGWCVSCAPTGDDHETGKSCAVCPRSVEPQHCKSLSEPFDRSENHRSRARDAKTHRG